MNTWFRYILLLVLIIPLSPILFVQGLIIKKRIAELPEAEGLSGICNQQLAIEKQMIIFGESTMSGVGILEHKNGFAGILAEELSQKLNININWKVYAQRGYTVHQLSQEIVPQIKEKHLDAIIIGVGGNDTFTLRNTIKWRKHVKKLITRLRLRYDNVPIIFLNIPPIKEFPAFSSLMKLILGNLSEILGQELKNLVSNMPNTWFNDSKIQLKNWMNKHHQIKNKNDFFCDGIHPSEITYDLWAKDMSEFIISKKILHNT